PNGIRSWPGLRSASAPQSTCVKAEAFWWKAGFRLGCGPTRAGTSTSRPKCEPTAFCSSAEAEPQRREAITPNAASRVSVRWAQRCGHDVASLSAEARDMDSRTGDRSAVSSNTEYSCRCGGARPGPLARPRRRQGALLGNLLERPESLPFT